MHELAAFDVSTTDTLVRDGDIVLLSMFDSDHDLGYRGDHVRESVMLRPVEGIAGKVQIVAANPPLVLTRSEELCDGWGKEILPLGAAIFRMWTEIRKNGDLKIQETESVAPIGIPVKKVVFYIPLNEPFNLVIV